MSANKIASLSSLSQETIDKQNQSVTSECKNYKKAFVIKNQTKKGNRSTTSSATKMTGHARETSVVLMLTLALFAILASIISIECHYKRTQYHEQGLHGPKSYKFGYTSGDHKNPQERHEVSDGHGHVKGWYSFVDANGKHQVVHYEAHPKYGFRIHNYKSKAYNNGKRHYNT